MSAYRGRTGPNFSEYLNSLNSLSPYEEGNFSAEGLDLDSDLAMFTNTDFTHFDIPPLPAENSLDFEMNTERPENLNYSELLGTDSQDLNVPQVGASPTEVPTFQPTYNTPIQPAPPAGAHPTEKRIPLATHSGGPSRRQPESADTDNWLPEEKSRLAAEEDKRRRNTAASARFRVKKKQREQALERSVKEVHEKNSKLEAKVSRLEMENSWLKNLITEKNAVQSKEEIEVAFEKFKRESEEREVTGEHTTGTSST